MNKNDLLKNLNRKLRKAIKAKSKKHILSVYDQIGKVSFNIHDCNSDLIMAQSELIKEANIILD